LLGGPLAQLAPSLTFPVGGHGVVFHHDICPPKSAVQAPRLLEGVERGNATEGPPKPPALGDGPAEPGRSSGTLGVSGGLKGPQASPSAPDLSIRFEGTLALAPSSHSYHGSNPTPRCCSGALVRVVAFG